MDLVLVLEEVRDEEEEEDFLASTMRCKWAGRWGVSGSSASSVRSWVLVRKEEVWKG